MNTGATEPMVVKDVGNVNDVRFEQFWKTPLPNVVTEGGIVMDEKEQP